MELVFENLANISHGSYPDIIQFYDTSAQVFFIDGGKLSGEPILKLNGDYSTPTLEEQSDVSPDTNISNLEIKTINGFGAVGSYLTGDTHKMIIYEFALELEDYLENGSIKLAIDSPITSFTLTLANPIDESSDKRLNVAISEKEALISPGAKVQFIFGMGDSEDLEMGTYYVDRSDFSPLRPDVGIDGRNLIGKALNDQTLDENNQFSYNSIHLTIKTLLENANLNTDQFLIEETEKMNSFTFEPNTTVLDAAKEIFKAMINWKAEELNDGTVVIGSPTYNQFTQPGTYTFNRGTDIFSRDVTRDDMDAYRRVCVHTSDFSVKVYRDVASYTGWNLQANKTLYVNIQDGTIESQAILYAEELALRLENVGKIESFTGPFRPYIMPGDYAHIVDTSTEDLGIITEVTHNFGKQGYGTNFTVDSGGRLGKGRISDYISKLTNQRSSGSIGYEETV
jgi:hypothetical protein